MPEDNDLNMSRMLEYNLQDSRLTRMIFEKLKIFSHVSTLCCVMKTIMVDVCRNTTGAMCATMLSSYALSINKVLDWSKCSTVLDTFEGGLVMEPIKGIHKNVVTVDFKSMYPTIMICCSISHDNVEVKHAVEDSSATDTVTLFSNKVEVRLNGATVIFHDNPKCLSRVVLEDMLFLRSRYKNNKVYYRAIKVATNSLFGSMGYENSPIYSPYASASVTCIGRFLLNKLKYTVESCGLRVLYGDTDSCFINVASEEILDNNAISSIIKAVESSLEVFHGSLRHTLLNKMLVEIEGDSPIEQVTKYAIFIAKKSYVLFRSNEADMKYKGICLARKDRLPILQKIYKKSILIICSEYSLVFKRALLCTMLTRAIRRILKRECSISEVSEIKRVYGNMSYVFKSINGYTTTELQNTNPNIVVKYDSKHVVFNVINTLDVLFRVSGMGTAQYILRYMH